MSSETNDPIEEILNKALHEATNNSRFFPDRFFSCWFRKNGSAYFFLFKKNLGVTNIQFAELLALIQEYTVNKVTGRRSDKLMFHSTDSLKETLVSIVNAFLEGSGTDEPDFSLIVRLYHQLLKRSVVVNVFHGSCAVFLPPLLDLDLLSVCAHSGYIHSCGRSVFVRNMDKANQRDFFNAIDSYLSVYPPSEGKIFFTPYAHEDFSGFDQDKKYIKEQLHHGLDDVKIHVEKVNMGSYKLATVLSKMRIRYNASLDIPDPGDYRIKHREVSDRTLWLICDSGINEVDITKPGKKKYYICYDQLYLNDNPFHIFDENKPAWVSHTTIPHTLLGAMVNISKPWPENTKIVLGDPFAGTGTTWFEALKFSDIELKCSDITPMFPQMIEDNLEFFSLDVKQLDRLIGDYEKVMQRALEIGKAETARLTRDLFPKLREPVEYYFVKDLIGSLKAKQPGETQAFAFSEDVVCELRNASFLCRLLFYTGLRAQLRFQASFVRGSTDWETAFQKSGSELMEQMKSFRDWRLYTDREIARCGNIGIFPGKYSHGCAISVAQISNVRRNATFLDTIAILDARNLAPKSCDLIVTDPPYGFNTDDELGNLASLYAEVIDCLVKAVKNEGHLIICLPDISHTGRALPYCTRSSLVIAQVLCAAERNGRTAFTPAQSLPLPQQVFMPPYYWESERALRRVILHFRIRDMTK